MVLHELWKTSYVRAALGIALVSLFAVVAFNYWQGGMANTLDAVNGHRKVCKNEIDAVRYAAEAAILGDAYFGGDRGYDLQCARAAYVRALSIDSRGDAQAWHQLGRIDFLEGKFDDAIDRFNKQIEYFGDTLPNVHYMLGLTYGYRARRDANDADWQLSETSFKKYLELDPGSPWARTDLAWTLFSLGRYEEMKPIVEEGLKNNPRHPWLLNMYGLSLLNTNDRLKAHSYFVDALDALATYTAEDWGRAYPGNDPRSWNTGLEEMRSAIEHNVDISEG